jgi:hypothetical protein
MEELYFLSSPCRDVISKRQCSRLFSSVGESVKRELEREDEEFPLLEAAARERLVKTAGWKRISGCCSEL